MAVDEREREAGGQAVDERKPGEGGKPGEPGKAPPDKKKDARRQYIIIVVSVVGVLIAWITYKSRGASSAQGATGPVVPTSGVPTAGDVAGSGDASQGFGLYLQNLSDEMSRLEASVSAIQTAVTPVTPPPIKLPGGNPPPGRPVVTVGSGAKGLKYIRDALTGHEYQVTKSGQFAQLSYQQIAALGNPSYTWYHASSDLKKDVPSYQRWYAARHKTTTKK